MTETGLILTAIEIITNILNAGTVADDSEILKELKDKEWGDDPPSKKDDNPNDLPPQIINNNNNQSNVKIYNEERKIYNNQVVFNIENNFNNYNFEKPKSKLLIKDTEENLKQTATQIAIGNPITLKQSISSQEFGKLLWNPVSEKKAKIRKIQDTDIEEKATELIEQAAERFTKFLEGYKDENDKPIIFDSFALIAPESIRGLSGKMSLIFGANVIRLLSYYSTVRSLNSFVGVTDWIPNGYEFIESGITYDLEYNNLNKLEINDTTKIDLGLPKGDINWESWIKSGIEQTFDLEENANIKKSVEDIADLLQYLFAQIYYRLGLQDYPFTVPESLVSFGEDGDKEIKEKPLYHLTDLIEWVTRSFDGVLGEFPFKIKIEDNDLIKTGNQTLNLTFPNIAETLAELTGKQIQQEAESKVFLNILLRLLLESATIKQQTIQNYYLSSANQEYLGYKTGQAKKEVEFLFNPKVMLEDEQNQTLSKSLEPSTLEIPIETNLDKNSLEGHMATLIEVARILKAQNWRKFDNKSDIADQFISLIKNAAKLADDTNLDKKEELKDFLNSVEKGFADKSSTIDATKPYGREYNRRPKANNLLNNGEST